MLKRVYKRFFKKLLATRGVGFLIYLYILMVSLTSKRRTVFAKSFNMKEFQSKSSIIAFWHGRMMLMYFLRPKNKKTSVFISEHADGKIIGNVSKLFNSRVIWGSSNKSPFRAIKEIFAALKAKESLGITPDGPRGPAREINSNIVKIASKHNLCIVPISYGTSRKRVFASWDNFILPLPFGKTIFIYGNPIKIPSGVTAEQVKKFNLALKTELDAISRRADELAVI